MKLPLEVISLGASRLRIIKSLRNPLLQLFKRCQHALFYVLFLVPSGCATIIPPPTLPGTARTTEVRGTWITTTANDAISTPANTASTMQRLREIGLNTVYVEVWKNGYTQFPSAVLKRAIGVDRSENPANATAPGATSPRDLLQETLIQAHRRGLLYVAWFEYGFMAAHKDTMNHLRRQKPTWLSRNIQGSEVAPNGFVWLNPLHPEARKLLLDLALEAIDKYDIDGIQLDDRIVWPHITMGYDDYTQKIYASEHDGRLPPADYQDAEWMRWRADKITEYARQFVQEVRAKRPGLLISLSPAVFPWSWENYLLKWPSWGAWTAQDRLQSVTAGAQETTLRWDEFIPQTYRFNYADFEKTWLAQVAAMKTMGADRQKDLIVGIRIVGDGPDSSWQQLRDSILLARKMGNGGHVLWFSRGVTDLYAKELTDFYVASGPATSPYFPAGWRKPAISLYRAPLAERGGQDGRSAWFAADLPRGRYRMIAFDGHGWEYLNDQTIDSHVGVNSRVYFYLPGHYQQAELLLDRRDDMKTSRATSGSPAS